MMLSKKPRPARLRDNNHASPRPTLAARARAPTSQRAHSRWMAHWRAQFTVQLRVRAFPEVEVERHRAVWPMTAHNIVGRRWNVMQFWMQLSQECPNSLLQRRRRIAFVASAIQADGRMVADAQQQISGIGQEHGIVVRLRPVPRIRQPEVLPDHD